MENDKTCKSCRWWSGSERCDVVDTLLAEVPATLFVIKVHVADDTGLNVAVHTGPDFGCVLHAPRRPNIRCTDCGADLYDGAVVCPRCRGVVTKPSN